MPTWTNVSVTAAADVYDLVVDALWAHSPAAVSEHEVRDGMQLVAGFDNRADAERAAAALADHDPVVHDATDDAESAIDVWRDEVEPARAAEFTIRLPRHDPDPDPDRIDLVIEPDLTFGFGHATTLLALELLSGAEVIATSVVDIGCGSGILSIAAAKLGARPVAVDIDPDAVAATVANAAANRVEFEARVGSAADVEPADVVVANMTAGTLIDLASDLDHASHDGHALLLSGILVEREDDVLAAFPTWRVHTRLERDPWIALHLTRRP